MSGRACFVIFTFLKASFEETIKRSTADLLSFLPQCIVGNNLIETK